MMYKLIVSCAFLCLFYPRLRLCEAGASANRGYVFTAPRRFLAGETESGCLSLHNLEPPAHVILELLSPAGTSAEDEVLTRTSGIIKTGIETCLELAVPFTKYFNGRLRLKIKFDKYPDYIVETEKEIYIEHDSLITFVETDKPVYKPGQDVNIRILMLKHDLKPWKKTIPKVWIENPSEVRVAQWANVSTENGMAQLKFALSPEPSPGTWKIKVEKRRSQPQLIHTTVFEVKKYVLPRFQVTITSPGYILADAENVTWNICAKYSYGKPVKGKLLLKSTPQIPTWRRKPNLPEIHYETELDSPDGCTEFVLSGAVLGLAQWKVAPNNIVLIANFTETGTGIVETSISRTVVVHQTLKLEFLPYTPKYFKLGLPYHGKLRVSRHDNTPAPHEKIQLCVRVRGKDEWLRVVVECRNFTSSSDGFVDFVVPPPHRNIVLLSFVATGIDYPTKYYSPDTRWRVFMDQPSAHIEVNPWYSPSDSYLAVARGYQPIVCGEKYSFNVMYTVPAKSKTNESISFHYSINSKGDLLIYGHVKHRPTRDTVLNYSEFRNLLGAVESPGNKTDQGTIAHRFPLSVKITPSMAPVSELLLYYVRSDGEIVATTYSIKVGHCFENKVKTAWHTDAQTPGTATQYHVEAAPWSLCGISAVDKSTRFLAGAKANLIDADQTFAQMKRFHIEPEPRPIWTWTHCKAATHEETTNTEFDHLPMPAFEESPSWERKRKRRTVYNGGLVNYVDAIQAFDDFGAVVMSDLILETRPCLQLRRGRGRSMNVKAPMIATSAIPFFSADMETDAGMFKAKTLPMAYPLLNVGPEQGYVDQTSDQPPLRSYFPETWLWELVPTGKEGKVTVERTLPHTITDWIGYTACVSPTHGLGIAPPTTITGFQPFFLDYSLPYSVKRGEMLRMKVSLFNYMQHSLPVKIKLEDATGLDLHLSHAVASFCVKPRDSVVHEYILRPRVLGDVNITVSASIDSDYAEPCGPEVLVYTRDVIVKPILVLPEGFPVEMTKSAFICPKDFSDDSIITWNLDLPNDLVPESARAYVSLIGDILGPALENLDKLVRLPMGCGEQNMILFVPNIHVIGYLDASGIDNPELRAKAIKNMEKGYQRELIYRHPDGSYSAFGPESSEDGSSIWLTAFVIKSFAQAKNIIHIDERDLKISVKWMVKKQLENGCFPVIGRVFHKDMKGGLQDDDTSSSALTAYILISLLESGVPLTASLINNALHCLEKGMENDGGTTYTAALSTYALTLLEHPKANNSMKLLMKRATRNNDLLWWEDKHKPSLGLSIEMTAYAVLSLVKLGGETNMVEALKAVRWMSKQRNAEGGFTSTQDTVLGLEALTKYAAAMSSNTTDLSVLVTAGEVDQVYRMYNDNRMVLTQIRLPVIPTIVEIFAEGEGCVLVQSNIKYNVAHATGSEAFDLSVNAAPATWLNECSRQKITICTRYKMADGESNMALLEINMVSGYVPDRTSLHSLLEDPATKVKRFEDDRGIVTIYFDKLINQKTCISFTVTRENIVDRLEPANVKLYDYYQQELTISSSYSFAATCSSATPSEEVEVPNPVPIEVQEMGKDTAKKDTVEKEEDIIEKTAEIPNDRNGTVEQIGKATQNFDLVKQLRDKVTNEKSVTGIQSRSENISPVDNSNPKVNSDDINTVTNVSAANNNGVESVPQREAGSGQTPDEPDINLNPVFDRLGPPSIDLEDMEAPFLTFNRQGQDPFATDFDRNPLFVVVDHELATPEGIEGPVPVSVKPGIIHFDDNPLSNMTNETDQKIEVDLNNNETLPPLGLNESCPVCADELPSNINEFYCSASSVVKAAIRRLRKARLLLDMQSSHEVTRLHSMIAFILRPNCSCPPLDNPGSLALLMHFEDGEFAKRSHNRYVLDEQVSIYGLPPIGGVPREITDARATCANQDNSAFLNLPTAD
ncbi:PREDICTED: alpha-2-macroglobulin-like protein 1 isoform X2 [Trachymyrmex septentrionalis]|uniref:alpha-2-macroglobulin-like protein 1 isoform X2 n=1 Tax=Trachymyrmex septentrionalis TaxID=34720 RepID=UPI00084EDF2B|nr:PREDICTED: alpha-2-macroglobulin-like protein 1 isoform X2 [Trachymyrmex septentrionalis]